MNNDPHNKTQWIREYELLCNASRTTSSSFQIVHYPYDRLGRPIPDSSVAITENFIWPPDNLIPDVEQPIQPVVVDIGDDDDSDFGDDLELPEIQIPRVEDRAKVEMS